MKWVAAIALVGLVLVGTPQRGHAVETGDAILTATMVSLASGFICGALAIGGEPASEQDKSRFDRKGPKIRLGVSGGAGPLSLGSNAVNTGWGVAGGLGYRCGSRYSAEAGVEYLNGFSIQGFDRGRKSSPVTYTANSRFYLLTGRVQPFALFGAGLMVADVPLGPPGGAGQTTGIAVRLGLGSDYYLTENIAVSGEFDWVRPFGAVIEDLDYIVLELGLTYRF